MINGLELKDFIVHCLEEKKASDIKVIQLAKEYPLADYMIFASGRSTKNIYAMAEAVVLELKQKTQTYAVAEGKGGDSGWVLIDAGDVIAHIFVPESREHFNPEGLWSDRAKEI